MTLTLAIIFGFMIFLLIKNKSNFLLIDLGAVLLIAAISFGVGYGMAVFVMNILGPLLKILLTVLAVVIGIGLVIRLGGKKE